MNHKVNISYKLDGDKGLMILPGITTVKHLSPIFVINKSNNNMYVAAWVAEYNRFKAVIRMWPGVNYTDSMILGEHYVRVKDMPDAKNHQYGLLCQFMLNDCSDITPGHLLDVFSMYNDGTISVEPDKDYVEFQVPNS